MTTFRPMRRADRALHSEEAKKLLVLAKWGTLSLAPDENGYPYGVMLNCAYIDGALYFHCAKAGAKIDIIKADDRVCFTAMISYTEDAPDYTAHFESVTCFGRVEFVPENETVEVLASFCASVFELPKEPMMAKCTQGAPRVQMLKMHIDHMTGKRSGPVNSLQ